MLSPNFFFRISSFLLHFIIDFQVHVEFMDTGDSIKIEGPPEEADKARDTLDNLANDLKNKMSFADISIDAKYHKHIIGKGGSNGKFLLYRFFSKIVLSQPKITNDDNSCASYDVRKLFPMVFS